MLFAIHCFDKPGAAQVRADNRPAHLEHLGAHMDQVVMVGPTQTDDGEAMTGSLIIMDFGDRAAAQAFADADPYAKAGLFETVSIQRFNKVLPK